MTRTVIISAPNNQPLNPIAEYLALEKQALLDRLIKYETKEDSSSFFGSGDDAVITITLEFDPSDTDALADMTEVIAFAKQYIKEIDIDEKNK